MQMKKVREIAKKMGVDRGKMSRTFIAAFGSGSLLRSERMAIE